MNRLFLFFVLPAVVCCTSCSKDITTLNRDEVSIVKFDSSPFEFESETRTNVIAGDSFADFSWSSTDTIGVFPENGGQVVFPIADGTGTSHARFSGGGWGLLTGHKYFAYYPIVWNMKQDKQKIIVDYSGQMPKTNGGVEHLGSYDYMSSAPVVPNNGIANFSFKHLGSLCRFSINVPEDGIFTDVKFYSDSKFVEKGILDLTVGDVASYSSVYSMSFNLNNIKSESKSLLLYFLFSPMDYSSSTIRITLKSSNNEYYYASITGKKLQSGKAYSFNVNATKHDIDDFDNIDM